MSLKSHALLVLKDEILKSPQYLIEHRVYNLMIFHILMLLCSVTILKISPRRSVEIDKW
jgi:hypothetical protein